MLCLAAFVVLLALQWFLHRSYRKPYIADFLNKSVFITGTDTGFGHELALALDRKGIKVYAGCYTKEGADNLEKLASSRLKTVQIDVTKKDSVVRAKEFIEKDLPPGEDLWGIVNNAGVIRGFAMCMSTLEDYRATLDVNLFGVISVTDTFLPLIKRSSGRIVNVISIAGRAVAPIMEPYICSKTALEVYTSSLRMWMKRSDVHVAAIEPGAFKFTRLYNTEMLEKIIDMEWERLSDDLKLEYGPNYERVVKQTVISRMRNPPFERLNYPEMVTGSIQHALFARHPKARYVCGFDANIYRLAALAPDWLLHLIAWIYFPYVRK